MNNSNKFKINFIAFFLLILFAGDTLAIWDAIEHLGFGGHPLVIESKPDVEIHLQDTEKTEQQSKQVDTCTLCPCCVSGVIMLPTRFTFISDIIFLNYLILLESLVLNLIEHHIFHPPRYSS